jgi:hypothetical protein
MQIFDELAHTRAALLDVLAGLDEEALDRKGFVGEWSAKNVLAHIAAWEEWVAQALPKRLAAGTTPADFRERAANEERFNAEEVAEREELTPSEQLMELERTREALLGELHGLDAATWQRRNLWDTWQGTLAEYLRDAVIVHEQEHTTELRAAATSAS